MRQQQSLNMFVIRYTLPLKIYFIKFTIREKRKYYLYYAFHFYHFVTIVSNKCKKSWFKFYHITNLLLLWTLKYLFAILSVLERDPMLFYTMLNMFYTVLIYLQYIFNILKRKASSYIDFVLLDFLGENYFSVRALSILQSVCVTEW